MSELTTVPGVRQVFSEVTARAGGMAAAGADDTAGGPAEVAGGPEQAAMQERLRVWRERAASKT
jgi:hypothetical protein